MPSCSAIPKSMMTESTVCPPRAASTLVRLVRHVVAMIECNWLTPNSLKVVVPSLPCATINGSDIPVPSRIGIWRQFSAPCRMPPCILNSLQGQRKAGGHRACSVPLAVSSSPWCPTQKAYWCKPSLLPHPRRSLSKRLCPERRSGDDCAVRVAARSNEALTEIPAWGDAAFCHLRAANKSSWI